jgi:dihydroorotate dehydrogenase
MVYRGLVRPALFALPPERASKLGELAFRAPLLWGAARPWLSPADTALRITLASMELPSPVGAAAGIDKDCRFLGSLLDIGFGFATGGTVTLSQRPGNPKPRLLRDPARQAVINAMGFPGAGLDLAERRLRALGDRRARLFVSVSGTIDEEILACHARLQPLVAAIEVNISSPNTAGLRVFHETARLRGLIELLCVGKDRPLFVKLPPWGRDADSRRAALLMAETAVNAGADGLIISNSHPVEHPGLAVGRGGLSGAPLFEHTVRMVAEAKADLPGTPVIACGGVSSARDVWELLAVGANAVQFYTALVYEGPGLPGRISRGLLSMMRRAGVKSVTEISGPPPA